MSRNDELPAALAADYRTAPIDAADRAMLDYAEKLTRTPASVSAADVESLRSASGPPAAGLRRTGFSDAAILDICQVTAYYAFVNRLADGLGVELEEQGDDG